MKKENQLKWGVIGKVNTMFRSKGYNQTSLYEANILGSAHIISIVRLSEYNKTQII